MNISTEELIELLLRTTLTPFTAKSLQKAMLDTGRDVPLAQVEDVIYSSPNVIELTGNSYITRAGAFTGQLFSAAPTAAEKARGVFVLGSRLMPFVDPERPLETFEVYVTPTGAPDGEASRPIKVPLKTAVFDSDDAIDMFMFYGEEYAAQYILSDPANAELVRRGRTADLPNTVRLTGLDLSFIQRQAGLPAVTRLYFSVKSWKDGTLDVAGAFEQGISREQTRWLSLLEKKLLASFTREGPLYSIEEQLLFVFFDNRDKLCGPGCASSEELVLKTSKKVGFQKYGVETRLWRKGEDVPSFGPWNEDLLETNEEITGRLSYEDYVLTSIPQYIWAELAQDTLYAKGTDFEKRAADFLRAYKLNTEDPRVAGVIKEARDVFALVSREYNYFRDRDAGPLRSTALALFTEVSALVYRINFAGRVAALLPPQEYITLFQIYSNLCRILGGIAGENFEKEEPAPADDIAALSDSVEGMSFTFAELRGTLEGALEREERRKFTVVKHEDEGSADASPSGAPSLKRPVK